MTRRSQPPYPPELRERAVRMVAEIRDDYDSLWAAMNAVADRLGVGTGETVRKWSTSTGSTTDALHSAAGDIPPAELEAAHYRQRTVTPQPENSSR